MNEAFISLYSRGTDSREYPCSSASFELRDGVSPSSGVLIMPVSFSEYNEILPLTPAGDVVTGRIDSDAPPQSANMEHAVTAPPQSGRVNPKAQAGVGSKAVMTKPARKWPTGNMRVVTASQLLRNEFSLNMKSQLLTGFQDENVHTVKIERLRASLIVPVEPPSLNDPVMCKVYIHDRRMDWQKMYNMDETLNKYKGLTENAVTSFWPESIVNPAAEISQRRPWNLREIILHLLALMGEFEFAAESDDITGRDGRLRVNGDRLFGYEYGVAFDEVFGQGIDAADLSVAPEDVGGDGSAPVAVLGSLLDLYRMKIWMTHESKVLIVPNRVEDASIPAEIGARVDSVPSYDSVYNSWSRDVVIAGPNIRVQEHFVMKKATPAITAASSSESDSWDNGDFVYVIPFNGEWVPVHEAYKRAGGSLALVDANVGNVDAFLATLQVLSINGDGEKLAAFVTQYAATATAGQVRMIAAVIGSAFKYVKILRGRGRQYNRRKMLESLLTISASGNFNQPVVIAPSWFTTRIRVSYNIGTPETHDLQAIADGAVETLTGVAANAIVQFREIPRCPFDAQVVDAEQCVLLLPSPLVVPTDQLLDAGRGFLARSVREHTAYKWKPVESIDLLVASSLEKFSPKLYGGVPGDSYSLVTHNSTANECQVSNVQPPTVLYRPEMQLDLILASFDSDAADIANSIGTSRAYLFEGDEPLVMSRTGELSVGGRRVDTIDRVARDIAARHSKGNIAENAVDVEYARIYVPLGVTSKTTDAYQYNSYLRSVLWTVDDNGATTTMRFGSGVSFMGDIRNSHLDIIKLMNQTVNETYISAIRSTVGNLGSHTGRQPTAPGASSN